MSILNRTKSYFFLVCILMCCFLSLLTWHLLDGTYNFSLLPGDNLHKNHSRQINKVRLATRRVSPTSKLHNLPTDKLGNKMIPMFDKMRINEEMISQKPLFHVQTSQNDLPLKSSNENGSKLARNSNVNKLTNHEAGFAMTSDLKVLRQEISVNQSVPQINIPLEDGLRINKRILDDVWKMYKENNGNFKDKLTNKYSKKTNNLPDIKDGFTDHKLNSKFKNSVDDSSKETKDSLGLNHRYAEHKLNPKFKNSVDVSSKEKKDSLGLNDGYTDHKLNPKFRNPIIPQNDDTIYLPSERHKGYTYNTRERTQQLTVGTEFQSSLNVKRPQKVKPYEHSVINSSRLAQLKKQHPWLVLSNFERLGIKTSYRQEVCQNCFQLDFPIIIERQSKCRAGFFGSTDMVIFIFSAPTNFEIRNVIRNTWGKLCHDPHESTMCLFIIGLSNYNVYNEKIKNESEMYSDILQIGFKDSYANLTYKTISMLKWAQENCATVRHIMKTDDDMYINTELIPLMMKAAPTSQFVGGFCWGVSRPNRDSLSKWYVSIKSFKREIFPPMCSGTGYVMSIDMAKSIMLTSKNIPFFHLEDVYIALCLQKLGVRPVNLLGFSNMFQEFDACRYRNEVMTSHQIPSEYLKLYWSDIEKCPLIHVSPKQIYIPLPASDIE